MNDWNNLNDCCFTEIAIGKSQMNFILIDSIIYRHLIIKCSQEGPLEIPFLFNLVLFWKYAYGIRLIAFRRHRGLMSLILSDFESGVYSLDYRLWISMMTGNSGNSGLIFGYSYVVPLSFFHLLLKMFCLVI